MSDRDQTLSDRDQTLSDRDQTLSDRDQLASEADQAAADLEHQRGTSPDLYSYERSAAIRSETARERLETAGLRDEAASRRDLAALERDQLAARRDLEAEALDARATELDQNDAVGDKHTLRVQELRARSAGARRRAAEDRARATEDRARAARDRELAARDREAAAHERRQAGTDELTGARRRGVGLEELEREMDRARRTGSGLVAVFVDVDDLKSINDRFGHSAGDELLCEVVDRLKGHMRSYDLVVRLGGDEFLCALPDVTPEEAHGRFDRLNAELRDGATAGPVSVSVGIAELGDEESVATLIERADRELLTSRARGS